MRIDQFILKLKGLKVDLALVEDQLKINAPKGVLTQELVAELKSRKEELLAFLRKYQRKEDDIQQVAAKGHYRVSHVQRRLWTLSQMPERSLAYNEFEAYIIQDELDVPAFEKALQEVIKLNEILRTNFKVVADDVCQFINPKHASGFQLVQHDIRSEGDQEAFIENVIAKEQHLGFDLENDSLLRAQLIRIADGKFIFLYSMHHIITDGWSSRIFIYQLTQLYLSLKQRLSNPFQPQRIQYKDYSEWQHQFLNGARGKEQEKFWRETLKGEIPVLNLPTTHPRPSVKTNNGNIYNYEFPGQLLADVNAYANSASVSRFVMIVSIINVLLNKYTGQSDIIVGTTVSGRDHEQLENQLGCFLNTLAIRNQIDSGNTFEQHLRGVGTSVLEALDHQHYPFDLVIEQLKVKNDPGRSPLFDVLIEYHNFNHVSIDRIAGESEGTASVTPYAYEKNTSQLDLTFSFVQDHERSLKLNLIYNTDLFDEAYIERLTLHLEALCQQVVNNPALSLSDYDILLDQERELINEFNQTARVIPEGTVIDQIARITRQFPDKIAIQMNEISLTYRELSQNASQLANLLLQQGLQKGDTVVYLGERGPEMLEGLLGIFMAGGVYLPLSTDYPIKRIETILNDSHTKFLVVDADELEPSFVASLGSNTAVQCVIANGRVNQLSEIRERTNWYRLLATIQDPALQNKLATLQPADHQKLSFDTSHTADAINVGVLTLKQGLSASFKGQKIGIAIEDPILSMITEVTLQALNVDYFRIDNDQSRVFRKNELQEKNITLLIAEYSQLDQLDEIFWQSESINEILILEGEQQLDESAKETDFKDIWNYQAEITTEQINDYGWTSSYTNEPFSIEEMEEYVHNFLTKLSPHIDQNTRVLEIGCGHGIVLFEVAPKVLSYVATDISSVILDKNAERLAKEGINNVTHYPFSAREIDQLPVESQFDVVVCSSVVHYFPNTYYFEKVIADAIDLIADTGVIYFDDLLDLTKKEKLVNSTLEYNKVHDTNQAKTDWDNDLFVGEDFFQYIAAKYPQIASIECSRKLGQIDNELNNYRFDALIMVDKVNARTASEYRKTRSGLNLLGQEAGVSVTAAEDFLTPYLPAFNPIEIVDQQTLKLAPNGTPDVLVTPKDLAYVIYTSGSTGKPKGAMVEHLGMLNHLYAKGNDLQLDEHSVVVQNASQTFDISIWQYLCAILVGGTTVVYDQKTVLTPESLVQKVSQDKITILEVVPSYLQVMLEYLEEYGTVAYEDLDYLVVTGETLQSQLVERWFALYPAIKVVNAYGPTEASDDITHHIMEEAPADGVVPIGKAVQNFNIYILNDQLQQVPIGVKGELYVSGIGVGRGYLNDPVKTAKSFGTDPFIKHKSVPMYRTGDLARYLPDGTIEFFGRIDNQVKVRGYRIELGEIEQKLGQIEGVQECAVIVHQAGTGQNSLRGFVSLNRFGGQLPDVETLKSALSKELPSYMVPDSLTILEELPHSINGKIDRKALAAHVTNIGITYKAPSNAVQTTLQSIWEALLDNDRISVAANFFELGGHSLLATRLISRIQQAFEVKAELREVFENPTIEALAAVIQSKSVDQYLNIPVAPMLDHYPLSHGQQRLWILNQLEESAIYNVAGAYSFTGQLDVALLEQAITHLIQRHESFRTSFVTERGTDQPVQVIHAVENIDFNIPFTDLRGAADQQRVLEQQLQKESVYQFDLKVAPLLKCHLFQLEDKRHVLSVTMHHIIADGWSLDIMIEEFYQAYANLQKGQSIPLQPLNISYKDFSYWQNAALQNDSFREAKEYWLGQFSDVPVLNLPYKASRGQLKTFEGASEKVFFSKEIRDAAVKISQVHDASLFMTLLASTNVLLHLYSGQRDLVVGTPIAGRNHSELESQIGLFTNTLAIRTQLKKHQSFADLLIQTRETLLEAYRHQQYPFDLLVEQLDLVRDMSRSPLFDVLVVLQNTSLEGTFAQIEGVEIENYGVEDELAKYDLTFNFSESEEGLYLKLNYNTDLFEQRFIVQLLDQLKRVLETVASQANSAISKMPFVAGEEAHRLIRLGTGEAMAAPQVSLMERFAQQAKANATATAVCMEGQIWTYKDLDATTNGIAHFLRNRHNVGRNSIVAVLLPRSPEFVVAMLSIIKAGGAYLPLAMDLPDERLKTILKESGTTVLVTNEATGNRLEPHRDLAIESIEQLVQNEGKNDEAIANINEREDLLYVIYTSGSTGTPKGVMIPHRSLHNYVGWFNGKHEITSDDRTLLLSSPAFDLCYSSLWTSLLAGAELHILKETKYLNSAELVTQLAQSQATYIKLTPSHLKMLLADATFQEQLPGLPLRLIVSGGEPIVVADIERILSVRPDILIVNHYGPSETTIGVISQEITTDNLTAFKAMPSIGKGIYNTRIYLLNEHGLMVPRGGIGEICVGGAAVGHGYLGKEALTAEKFIADPHHPGQVIYRTGDIGYWNQNDTISFIGRNDHQIKFRGYRIEISEIKNQMEAFQGVRRSHVSVEKSNDGNQQLIAYYVGADEVADEQLKTFLQERLPDYMIPAAFVALEEFPLTGSGKINEKQLATIEKKVVSKSFVPASSKLEKQLVDIWEEATRFSPISVQDNFFSVGGNSLLATIIVARIEDRLKLKLSLKDLFLSPTIQEIATILDSGEQMADVQIKPAVDKPYYELSHGQRRLWILDQLKVGESYNISTTQVLKGKLDQEALEKSFQALVERHEILRTKFITLEGKPYQKILDAHEQSVDLEFKDLNGEHQEAINLAIDTALSHEFDLAANPPFKVTLVKASDEVHYLIVNMHHILSDVWSKEILVSELNQCYQAFVNGTTPALEKLAFQYKDYAEWQAEQFSSGALEASKSYWHGEFSEHIPVLELPTDFPRPQVKSFKGDVTRFQLDEAIVAKLQSLSEAQECSVFNVLLAATKVLLYKYTQQEELIVGIPTAGRQKAAFQNQVGFYLNMLPIKSKLDGNDNFAQSLQKVKAQLLQTMDHQEYPFDALVDELHLSRDTSRSPVFDVLVSFENISDNIALNLSDIAVEDYQLPALHSKYDLSFYFSEQAEGIQVTLEYSTDLFKASRIERIKDYFLTILEGITGTESAISLNALNYIPPAEQQHLLVSQNNTKQPYDEEKCLHQYFEDQVVVAGAGTAIVFDNQTISYEVLNEGANKVAHHLLTAHGLQPGTVVGLCIDRGPKMVMAMLGIMKAGGCYLPIDPDFPKDRIAYLLKDSDAAMMIVSDRDSSNDIAQISIDALLSSDLPAHNPDCRVGGADKVYMLYTSGSTGQPKGVMIPHKAVTNFMRSMQDELQIGSDERWLALTTVSFDISVLELFLPLLTGNQVVLASASQAQDPAALQELLVRQAPTIMQATPSLWYMLLESGWKGQNGLKILSGGEYLNPKIGKRLLEAGDGLWNLYGPTETTIWSTVKEVKSETDLNSIGKPIANTQIYLLDRHQRLVATGVPGEIYIGGTGLAIGYHQRPELTASRFIHCDIADGERLYRTGDLAQWNEQGELQYLGRIDDQIKVRGHRIEPGEIQTQLNVHPGIKQSQVHLHTDDGEAQLIAYYISTDESLTSTELRSHLKDTLPDYMIPDHFMALPSFPLTPNGKLDKSALPLPDGQQREDSGFVAPRTTAEQQLQEIWQQVLKLPQVSVQDNFFEIGGHSLKAIQVLSKINADLGISLTLSELFNHSTIAELAPVLATADGKAGADIAKVALKEYHDTSNAQKQIWLGHQYEDRQASFVIPTAFNLQGDLDIKAVERAYQQLIDRHESLRTTFVFQSDHIYQRIASSVSVAHCLELLDKNNGQFDQDAFLSENYQAVCDLENGPLHKIWLVQTAPDETVLLIAMHHIISDAWSVNLFVNELLVLYKNEVMPGTQQQLPALAIQYKDYVEWLKMKLNSDYIRKTTDYWVKQLAEETPRLSLPLKLRGKQGSARVNSKKILIDQTVSEQLRTIAVSNNTTLFVVTLTAIKCLLSRYLETQTTTIATPVSGRDNPKLHPQIGLYIDLLLIRQQLDTSESFNTILHQVKANVMESLDHQYPYDLLADQLNLGAQSQYEVGFTWQNTDEMVDTVSLSSDQLVIEALELVYNNVKTQVWFHGWEYDGQVALSCTYQESFIKDQGVDTLLKDLTETFQLVSQDTEKSILDIHNHLKTNEEMKKSKFDKNENFKKFLKTKKKVINVNTQEMVSITPLSENRTYPLLVKPQMQHVVLGEWLETNKEKIRKRLEETGAMLFRGFDIKDLAQFKQIAGRLGQQEMDYVDQSSPRTRVSNKVYTSTDFPQDQVINLHNELSYSHEWPLQILFYCHQAPETGGETPIADSHVVYQNLSEETISKFRTRGIKYVRNMVPGIGLSWQDVYQTEDRAEVESICHENGILFEWVTEDHLRISWTRPAIQDHPTTNLPVWFNHGYFFNARKLDQSLLAMIEDKAHYPFNTFYGTGEEIEEETMQEIEAAFEKAKVAFPWQEGDILLLDNMRMAHARNAFEGNRKVYVAMNDPFSLSGVELSKQSS